MEFFILNSSREIISMVQNYESMVWAERYSAYGDFELIFSTKHYLSSGVRPGLYLHTPDSNYLMRVETVDSKTHSDDDKIVVSGRSMESLLLDRAVSMNSSGDPYKDSGGTAGIATRLVRRICGEGDGFSSNDQIPNLIVAEPTASHNITEVEIPPKPLYDAVKELCDSEDLGWRIRYDPSDLHLYFWIYRGIDLTSSGPDTRRIFSPDYDSLSDVKSLKSIKDYKNVAYVLHNDRKSILEVPRRGISNPSGVSRRVLIVDANDIEEPTLGALRQRAYDELAQHNRTDLVEGTIDYNMGDYRSIYNLGDLVTVDDGEGSKTTALIDEHIWAIDIANGTKSYPTFRTI